MRIRLARLISNTLNPFVISAAVVILLAFHETSSTTDALKWASISLAISVLPVFIAVTFLVQSKKIDGFLTDLREQRSIVYLLASALGAVSCGLLWYLKAPELLAVTFTAGLISIIVFTGINYFWKISLHTAFMAASLTIMIIVYRVAAVWVLVFLPLVAWARIESKQHSIMQVVIGGVLAAAIVVGVFFGFRVVGK
jgi:membrane-associated phospholipid phosphatase